MINLTHNRRNDSAIFCAKILFYAFASSCLFVCLFACLTHIIRFIGTTYNSQMYILYSNLKYTEMDPRQFQTPKEEFEDTTKWVIRIRK